MSLLWLPDSDIYIRTESIDTIEPNLNKSGDTISITMTRTGAPWTQDTKTGEMEQVSEEFTGGDMEALLSWANMEAETTKASLARYTRARKGQEAAVDISKKLVPTHNTGITGIKRAEDLPEPLPEPPVSVAVRIEEEG